MCWNVFALLVVKMCLLALRGGNMLRYKKTALIVILLALLALPSAALAAAFTLTPTTPGVAAGQTMFFTGSGFTPGEQVAIWATAPDQTVISGDFEFAKGA